MSDEPTCWDILLEAFLRRINGTYSTDLGEPGSTKEFAEKFAWELYGFPGGRGIEGYEVLKSYLVERADQLWELQSRSDVSMDEVEELLGELAIAERLQAKVFQAPQERKQLSTEEYWKWRASVENED